MLDVHVLPRLLHSLLRWHNGPLSRLITTLPSRDDVLVFLAFLRGILLFFAEHRTVPLTLRRAFRSPVELFEYPFSHFRTDRARSVSQHSFLTDRQTFTKATWDSCRPQ